MNDVLFYLAYAIRLYLFVLLARMVMSLVVAFTSYRPTGAAAVAFEFVYTVTDPPLKALRRVIPDLRMGNVGLDLSFIVLSLGLSIISGQLFEAAKG